VKNILIALAILFVTIALTVPVYVVRFFGNKRVSGSSGL
jgi:hypothetical protein